MDDMGDIVKDCLLWIFAAPLAAKRAVDDLDEMLTGEKSEDREV